MNEPLSLMNSLFQLSSLYVKRDTIAAPFVASIQPLEYDCALATAEVDAEIAALESLCKPLVLTGGKTVRAGTLMAVYQSRTHWDSKGLLAYAKEQPTILQFHDLRPLVMFRRGTTGGPRPPRRNTRSFARP